jgi:hypothetical protein
MYISDCQGARSETVVGTLDEQTQKQRRKCHLPSRELAGKSEKQWGGFGAGVSFGSDAGRGI